MERFRITGPLWGESTGGFPSQKPVTWSFIFIFFVNLNKLLKKQSSYQRFEKDTTAWASRDFIVMHHLKYMI